MTTAEAPNAGYIDVARRVLRESHMAWRRPILGQRELQALALMARGLTNKQIAGEMHISDQTVKNHLSHSYEKLGLEGGSFDPRVVAARAFWQAEMESHATD